MSVRIYTYPLLAHRLPEACSVSIGTTRTVCQPKSWQRRPWVPLRDLRVMPLPLTAIRLDSGPRDRTLSPRPMHERLEPRLIPEIHSDSVWWELNVADK